MKTGLTRSLGGRPPKGTPKARRLGPRAAANRAAAMRRGAGVLPGHKDALLVLTGRLLAHAENVSNDLFRLGEVKADEEPRVLLDKLLHLSKEARTNLAHIFGDDADDDDPIAAFMRQRQGEEQP